MTPELWNLYLQLQTTLAYSGAHPAPLEESVLDASVEFFQSVLKDYPNPRVLVIGPWGHNEIVAWRRAGAVDLQVLTAHQPEADELATVASMHVGDIHAMSFPSASFDLVAASNVLEHVFAPYIALMECRRVLRPGGATLFTFPSFAGPEGGEGPFHLHCLDVPVWKELLRKTGHRLTQEWAVPGGFVGSVAVRGLLAQNADGSFEGRTGCAHYWTSLCEAVVPPYPHDKILEAVSAHKGGI